MNKIDAINEILINLNETPVDETTQDPYVIPIVNIIDKQIDISTRKVLSKGWFFNKTTLTVAPTIPDGETFGYIPISSDYLSVDGGDAYPAITVRDNKLFDKSTTSYNFESSVTIDVVENIADFADIPYHIANYITELASFQMYMNLFGSASDLNARASLVQQAATEAYREDLRAIDGNILAQDYATDLLDRTGI
jgi:hypothetical protein